MRKSLLMLTALAMVFAIGCDHTHFGLHFGGNSGGKAIKGSGIALEEARSLPEFTDIELSGAYEVVVTCGEEQDVQISGDDNIVPLVKTEVIDKVLIVSTDESISPEQKLTLTISAETIDSMNISGAVSASISHVDNQEFAIDLSGAGDLEMEGSVDDLQLLLSGAGSIDAEQLAAKTATVDVSGVGSVVLSASDELYATISGLGDVEYCGDPQVIRKRVSGLGKIKKK